MYLLVEPIAAYSATAFAGIVRRTKGLVGHVRERITVDVEVTDTSASASVFLVKGAAVPAGGALVPIGGDQKVVLETTDIIKVTSSAASSADVIVSVLEQS